MTEDLRVEMKAAHEQQRQDAELKEQLEYTKRFQVLTRRVVKHPCTVPQQCLPVHPQVSMRILQSATDQLCTNRDASPTERRSPRGGAVFWWC